MELRVQGSSSAGNSYVLCNQSEALLIEAGCPMHLVLGDLEFHTKKVVGCLVSHSHQDHSKNVCKYQDYGFKCYMSAGTASEVKGLRFPPEIIRAGELVTIGRFKVLPFATIHDCKEPLGFLIQHPEIGVLLFAIDTAYLPYTFDGLTNVLIECNHTEELLRKNVTSGYLHPKVGKHIRTSHLSLQTCIEALRSNDLTQVSSIVLLHLSKDNGDPELFQSEVAKVTGKQVYIAQKGLKVKLGKTPF